MARAAGVSISSSAAHLACDAGLQPHRVRQFKLSNDPEFVDKLRGVVGLYVDPPTHAVVLSVDEEPNPGPRSCSARPADEGPRRNYDR